MVFFQLTLLAGYGYAHVATRRLGARRQALVHLGLLGISFLFLPVAPSGRSGAAGAAPEIAILGVLVESIGLPFLLLSATSPLLQTWSARMRPEVSPFPLYASSNAGSLLALVSYPFLVEPTLGLRAQAGVWSVAYVAFALLVAGIALLGGTREPVAAVDFGRAPLPRPAVRALWFALSASAAALLLAVTNQLCLDVAPAPFLWIVPLAIYLATFVLCFESERAYARRLWFLLLVPAFAGGAYLELHPLGSSLATLIAIYGGGLFVGSMLCHGELARLRPHPDHLTGFYGWIAFGGATGSAFVAFAAPRLFDSFAELPLLALGIPPLVLFAAAEPGASGGDALAPSARRLAAGLAGALGALALLPIASPERRPELVAAGRNFYGVLRVVDLRVRGQRMRTLFHGITNHGGEIDGRSDRPTSYYGPESGLGLALSRHRSADGPRRIGVIGLGAGTIAAYGRPGDWFRFYEINPLVVDLAGSAFGFVSASPATVEIAIGDGRLELEREPPRRFDLLVADAFSSDSIPTHLLTVEAFEVYRRHLAPGGLLAVHVSNRYVDVAPVVAAAAARLGFEAITILAEGNRAAGLSRSRWMILGAPGAFFEDPVVRSAARTPRAARAPWTDDASSLFSALR